MLRALGGKQKCSFGRVLQRYLRTWGNMISVAPLVVPTVEKQEGICSFIVFQRILTEEGFG